MVFLRGESFTNWKGTGRVNAILFPMNEIFESYVTAHLRQSGLFTEFTAQNSSLFLARENGNRIFQIKPDITAKHEDKFFIMDAKWKLIDETDRANKYDISQSDMYQMLSYAKIYEVCEVKMTVSLVLIYPATDKFREQRTFVFNDKTSIKITIWPFDIEKSMDKEIVYCYEMFRLLV